MSGHRMDPDKSHGFDFFAKTDGQVVHCQRAAFFTTGGIPTGSWDRIRLGIEIGVGLTMGIASTLCVAALLRAAFKVLAA